MGAPPGAIALDANYAYVGFLHAATIVAVPRFVGGMQTVWQGNVSMNAARQVAVDSSCVYWVDELAKTVTRIDKPH